METIKTAPKSQGCNPFNYGNKGSFNQLQSLKAAKNKKRVKITKLDLLYTIAILQLFTFALLLNAILINLFTI
jgi:hypothetical protein